MNKKYLYTWLKKCMHVYSRFPLLLLYLLCKTHADNHKRYEDKSYLNWLISSSLDRKFFTTSCHYNQDLESEKIFMGLRQNVPLNSSNVFPKFVSGVKF